MHSGELAGQGSVAVTVGSPVAVAVAVAVTTAVAWGKRGGKAPKELSPPWGEKEQLKKTLRKIARKGINMDINTYKHNPA